MEREASAERMEREASAERMEREASAERMSRHKRPGDRERIGTIV
jgi:hypothetical protein